MADALSQLQQHESQREEVINSLFTPDQLGALDTTRSQAKPLPRLEKKTSLTHDPSWSMKLKMALEKEEVAEWPEHLQSWNNKLL